MKCLRETVDLEELLVVGLSLLLKLKVLVNDLLELLFELHLHDSHLGWHDVSQLLFYGELSSEVVKCWLKLHEVLAVRLGDLFDRELSVEVDS